MSIFIRNTEVVRKAREIAARRGTGITATIEEALDLLNQKDQAEERPVRTLESLMEATRKFHEACGGLKPDRKPLTKEEWDELNEIGFPEIDDA